MRVGVVALRNRSVVGLSRAFWLSALCVALAPTTIGRQDLAGLLARQAGISDRWRDHLIASPFGTIHTATFAFARPVGTAMSEWAGVEMVNFDPRSLDVKVWAGNRPPLVRPTLQVEYPTVNRRLKGDRMPLPEAPASSGTKNAPPLQPVNAPPQSQPAPPSMPVLGPRPKSVEQLDISPATSEAPVEAFVTLPAQGAFQGTLQGSLQAALSDDVTGTVTPSAATLTAVLPGARENEPDDDIALADKPPEIPAPGESDRSDAERSPFASLSFLDEDASERKAQLYFSGGVMGARARLETWPLGAEPVLASPGDPDVKLSALQAAPDVGPGGETVAGKDDASRLMSPAERLGLDGRERAKAEKCLADAVYFEARGEPPRGQMAVAQVVMNRVFSGYYPNNVCGVVYQNANRHLACQFTFACEGKNLSRIDELDMWEQAKRIAKDMLDGKIWLTEVGHATHYHAYWVHPSWVHEMNRMYRLGVHTFYRPRAWGDGSDAPIWGAIPVVAKSVGSPETPEAAKEPSTAGPEAAARLPQAAASPETTLIAKSAFTARL